MPDRPPNCRTAEIACTVSEMHALSPKLAGKRCKSGYLIIDHPQKGSEDQFQLISSSAAPAPVPAPAAAPARRLTAAEVLVQAAAAAAAAGGGGGGGGGGRTDPLPSPGGRRLIRQSGIAGSRLSVIGGIAD